MAVDWRTPRKAVGKPLLRPWMAPPRMPGLVARPALSERLLAAAEHATAVLHGPAGYGQTTLATWLCHRPETRERFPGGLLWITLGEHVTGPELTIRLNGLLERLTGSRPTHTDPDEAGDELQAILSTARDPILLVLDGADGSQRTLFE